jgi:hypothetical protein
MKFYFSVPVWGANHTDLFINAGLPSLLAPGNIPGLREVGECRFFVHTRPEDEARLVGAPSFQRLLKEMPVEIRLIRDPIVNPYITMSGCHREIMRLATAQDVPVVFPSPDHVWGDGSMVRMERLAEAGKTAIHLVGVRLDRDSFVKGLAEWRSADGTLVIPPRALVKLALAHRHRIAGLHFWDEDEAETGNQLNPSNLFWLVGNDGLVAHCFHLHPLMVHAEVRTIEFSGTIDDDLVSLACPDLSRQYVVSDSDEIVNFEISGPEHTIPSPCVKGSIDGVCQWAVFHTNPLHRHLFQQCIKLHSADLFDCESKNKFEAVDQKVGKVVREISSLNRMPTWCLFIKHPQICKARLEKTGREHKLYPLLRLLWKSQAKFGAYAARAMRVHKSVRLRRALGKFFNVLMPLSDRVSASSPPTLMEATRADLSRAQDDADAPELLSPHDVSLRQAAYSASLDQHDTP